MTKKTQLTKELEEWLNDFAMKKYGKFNLPEGLPKLMRLGS